ncbi:class I SAM-dependent methyltransferase [Gracilibacillus caseinilyticus]|uniref:Class I SAM-dependent methyltransferase n=1 Tax=Gracilibacillus caseinilyticus TaxID=2932256 RepID=A0ABY4F2U3_9BACI|nr:class I SAM-dependent methyltransferase [Gracilibacillus caseinilyticus]UOQ50555.1 class I SAM-dependent methyltransferase [Gracilibacillus caseinilyticus]
MNMFALTKESLIDKKILDCPAGACSFTAIGNQSGLDVTACDIAYHYSVDFLQEKGHSDIKHAMEHMKKVKNNYQWGFFAGVEDLRAHRIRALQTCTKDIERSKERYIPVTLPSLPFRDEQFDIILSAHFLFLYADRLDLSFHLDTVDELLRVTKEELRIFPLVDLNGARYQYLDEVIHYLIKKGCTAEEIKVSYEFQRNANSMLKICKKGEQYD